MKLKPYQRDMIDDGLPLKCVATDATIARARKYWDEHPPVTIPFARVNVTRDESPETKAFRAAEDERRRLKSLAGISRMKARFVSKAIDYSKMSWDARRNKFVPLVGDKPVSQPMPIMEAEMAKACDDHNWSRVTKDTAKALAFLNGVWDPKYERLSGGLLVMTVTNRLKGVVKRGGQIKWRS